MQVLSNISSRLTDSGRLYPERPRFVHPARRFRVSPPIPFQPISSSSPSLAVKQPTQSFNIFLRSPCCSPNPSILLLTVLLQRFRFTCGTGLPSWQFSVRDQLNNFLAFVRSCRHGVNFCCASKWPPDNDSKEGQCIASILVLSHHSYLYRVP